MNFVSEDISAYCEELTKPESEVLQNLDRETYLKMLMPQMLTGHLQGKFLSLISSMIRPQNILEIGTFTGYSAICLAAGLKENGKLITIDINDELETTVNKYFAASGFEKNINFIIGDARNIIPTLNESFDLVFIDADKESYPEYYDLIFDKVSSGGYIIADNALWSGKVLENEKDKDAQGIHDFNKKVVKDKRVDNVLLPLRDGIMIARKL